MGTTPEANIVALIDDTRRRLASVDDSGKIHILEEIGQNLQNNIAFAAAYAEALSEALSEALLRHEQIQAGSESAEEPSWLKQLKLVASKSPHPTADQRLRYRAIATSTLYWGKKIMDCYDFASFGKPTAVSLSKIAERYPEWPRAVQRINAAMLHRHIAAYQSQRGNIIGCHSANSSIKDSRRPIEKVDLDLVLEWKEQSIIALCDIRTPDLQPDVSPEIDTLIVRWTAGETLPVSGPITPKHRWPTAKCLVGFDVNGLLVPRALAHRKRGRQDGPEKPCKRPISLVGSGPVAASVAQDSTTTPAAANALPGDARGTIESDNEGDAASSTEASNPHTLDHLETRAGRRDADNDCTPRLESTSALATPNSGVSGHACTRLTTAGKSLRPMISGKIPRIRPTRHSTAPRWGRSTRSGSSDLFVDQSEMLSNQDDHREHTQDSIEDGENRSDGSLSLPRLAEAPRLPSTSSAEAGDHAPEAQVQDKQNHRTDASFFDEAFDPCPSPGFCTSRCSVCAGPCRAGSAVEGLGGPLTEDAHSRILVARDRIDELAKSHCRKFGDWASSSGQSLL